MAGYSFYLEISLFFSGAWTGRLRPVHPADKTAFNPDFCAGDRFLVRFQANRYLLSVFQGKVSGIETITAERVHDAFDAPELAGQSDGTIR